MTSIHNRYLQRLKRQEIKNGLVGQNLVNIGTSHWLLLRTSRKAQPGKKDRYADTLNKESQLVIPTETRCTPLQTDTWTNSCRGRGLREH